MNNRRQPNRGGGIGARGNPMQALQIQQQQQQQQQGIPSLMFSL